MIVLVGELPDLDTMSEDLKMYVRARSYISITDSWFWRKLRYNNPTKEIFSYFILHPLFRYSLSKKTESRDKEKLEDLDEVSIDATQSNVPYYRQISTDFLLCKSKQRHKPVRNINANISY